jgi:hypothetical protein
MNAISLEPGSSSKAIPEIRDAAPSQPVSVCLLISSLEFGGAERQVVEMMRTFDPSRVNAIVCSLSRKVPLADALQHSAWPGCCAGTRSMSSTPSISILKWSPGWRRR